MNPKDRERFEKHMTSNVGVYAVLGFFAVWYIFLLFVISGGDFFSQDRFTIIVSSIMFVIPIFMIIKVIYAHMLDKKIIKEERYDVCIEKVVKAYSHRRRVKGKTKYSYYVDTFSFEKIRFLFSMDYHYVSPNDDIYIITMTYPNGVIKQRAVKITHCS